MPDLPARLKALAELERPCPEGANVLGQATHMGHCSGGCDGTGHSALFKGLRLPCRRCQDCVPDEEKHSGKKRGWYALSLCQGRGWVPEPNLRVACWELAKVENREDTLSFTTQFRDGQWEYYDPKIEAVVAVPTAEEAVISAAEAWAEEAQRG